MNSLFHSFSILPHSSSTLKTHPMDSRLNNFHEQLYQLAQLVKLSKNDNQNHIFTRATRACGVPHTPGTNYDNLNTQSNNFSNLEIEASDLGFRNPILVGECCHTVNEPPVETNKYFEAGLRQNNLPEHVAIILDGSRRWLKAHGKPLSYGPYFESNLLFADLCIKWGVTTATTFVYSLKNLERGKEANHLIFGELENFLEHNVQQFRRKGIKIMVIGETQALPETLQNKIREVEEATKECTKLEFMLALCYAGTRDIVRATRNICEKVNNGEIDAKDIDELLLENELSTNKSRHPQIDLLIRTGGRTRASDFLMWQLAQAELYFTDIRAPDFCELEFIEALRSYQQRERTLGK